MHLKSLNQYIFMLQQPLWIILIILQSPRGASLPLISRRISCCGTDFQEWGERNNEELALIIMIQSIILADDAL